MYVSTSDYFTENQKADEIDPYKLYEKQILGCVFYLSRAGSEYFLLVSIESKFSLVRTEVYLKGLAFSHC